MGGRIPLFGIGQSAKSPYVTAKRLQNIYVEQRPDGEKSMLVGYQTPGLDLFDDFGATPCRGGLEFEQNSVAYAVHRGVLWEVNNAGVATNRGLLLTNTGRVSMAHNGVQVMIVDGQFGYIYNTNTAIFAPIVDGDFPANPVTVTCLSRRFVVSMTGSSRFYCSDIDNGLSWDALMFANAEVSSDPIVSAWSSNGQLILSGSNTTEFWGNSGALDFPFAALQGTATEWGLAARWSIAKYDNSFACLIRNRMAGASGSSKNGVMVAKMAGYLPQKISNVDMDSIINGYMTVDDATAYSYMLGGHPMYCISFPSAGASWLFDGSTNEWTQLKSFGLTRHRGEFAFTLINSTILADYSSGRLYRLNADTLTDNGDSIEKEIVGETVATPTLGQFSVDCLRLDMETGVGTTTGQGVNPQIGLSISRDNGRTWGPQMWKTMGALGEYSTRIEWRRLGSPRYFTPKITVTDPVKVVFVSACINPDN